MARTPLIENKVPETPWAPKKRKTNQRFDTKGLKVVCQKLSYGYTSEPGSAELGHDISICNVFNECLNCPLLFNDKQQLKLAERRKSEELTIVDKAVLLESAHIRESFRQ